MKSRGRNTVGARFRAFRRSKKMSQKMLALCLGISRREVINIEQGVHVPYTRNLDEFDALVERHRRA